jgi:crotonobetainyl-CoA:carnitine CoA-transferase CaiB-like acyl-CoA transferase
MTLARKDYDSDATGPLQGVRVLDLSRLFAGNVLTQLLGDFGADVIKVEPPGGDTLRDWKVANVATHWQVYGRNKRSLCLNLRDPRGVALLKELIPTAQILLESFRPGVLEEMDLAPDGLLAINPKLCIGRISGWGQTGPYAGRPAFGTIIEGFSGFAAMNGFADREPVLPPMYLADGVAGLHGAAAIMIALREIEVNGGRGQVIDLSLLEPLLALLGPHAANHALTNEVRKRTGSRSANSAPRNVYRCADGQFLSLSASTETMAARLFTMIGRRELISDPRFVTNASRLRYVDELDEILGAYIGERPLAANLALFHDAGVTVGPIYSIAEIREDPHVCAREVLVELVDKDSRLAMSNIVPTLEQTPGRFRLPAPTLGEHSRAVLSEIGIGGDRFAELLRLGIVIEPT